MKDEEFIRYHKEIEELKEKVEDILYKEYSETKDLAALKFQNERFKFFDKMLEEARSRRRIAVEEFILKYGLNKFFKKHTELNLRKNFDTFDLTFFNTCAILRQETLEE